MDFIDFDSFQSRDELLTQPQPALPIPISSNIENLGKRFSNLNSLTRNLLSLDDEKHEEKAVDPSSELAKKYAQLSIELLEYEKTEEEPEIDSSVKASIHPIPGSSSTLSSRLSRVLNNHLSDSLTREIFTTLQEKFPENTHLIETGTVGSLARKRLVGEIEGELIKNQTLVLKEYYPVISQLKELQKSLANLNDLNKVTNEKVDKNYDFSSSFNYKIKALNDEKHLITLKKNLLISFKKKFTLNEYEEYILSSGDINDEFFQTLKKAEEINENCSILLAIDNPQLGLKIMSKINSLINKAIDRLTSFCNKTLSNLYSLNQKSKLNTLRQCLKYLKNKMNYFNSIINSFIESRSKSLLDEFLTETTKTSNHEKHGVEDNNVRPVFVSEHDPIRYIGDLLAYIHSIVVNESDLIHSIFDIEEEKSEFDSVMTSILDQVLKSIARPVRSKIDQIITSETKLTTIHSIFNLVELYSLMLSKQLQKSNELLKTIDYLISSSRDRISGVINSRLLTIQNSNSAKLDLNLDLQPPEWIIEYFADILPIIDQMAINSNTILNYTPEENAQFLNAITDKPIEIFYSHVQTNKLFTLKSDQLILKLNFLDLILSKIIPISFLGDKVLELDQKIRELTQQLSQQQLDHLLNGCKLYDCYNVMNMIYPLSNDDEFEPMIYEPIKENKLFNREHIGEVNEQIKQFLPNALMDIQNSLMKLNSPNAVNEIVDQSCGQFSDFYEKFGKVVGEFLDMDLGWSANEVRILLGVAEKE